MQLLWFHPRAATRGGAAHRANTTAVIGTTLSASAREIGYRHIATQLQRPASTVGRWVRASATTTTSTGYMTKASGKSPSSTLRP